MTEPVIIALITNGTIFLVAVLSRWMSHIEHKASTAVSTATNDDVKQIKAAMNGIIK